MDTLEIALKKGAYVAIPDVEYRHLDGEIVFQAHDLQSFREEIEKLERERIIANYPFFNSEGKWLAEAIRKGDKP